MTKPTRTVLITGGTSGLGYQCALKLAKENPDHLILIASRSDPDSAAASINRALSQDNVQYLPLDLASLAKVRAFIANYASQSYPPVQALVLNAGIQFVTPPSYTEDGIEKTFAINHVGHALLFYLMRPYLAKNARVVITASGVHDPAQKTGLADAKYVSAEELAKPTGPPATTDGRQRYSSSKLCNVLWTYALDRRIKASPGQKWTVTAMDPGLMPGTGLARDAPQILQFVFTKILPHVIPLLRLLVSKNIHTPQDSGAALADLAVGKDLEGVSGAYFEGIRKIDSSVDSYVVEKQEDLWNWTLKTVAKDEEELQAFGAV